MDDDFPLDHHGFTIMFPCFMVLSEDGNGFSCHELRGGGYMVVVLTDEDSLNSYRQDIGLPERGAVRFTSLEQLLAALDELPSQVTHLAFDSQRHRNNPTAQATRLWRIHDVRHQLAAQIPQ